MSQQLTPVSQPLEMRIVITDKGASRTVSNVDPWVLERKELLQKAAELLRGYDGRPASLREHYPKFLGIVKRLNEIKAIFDEFNAQRLKYADANIRNLIDFLSEEITWEDSNG